MDTNRPASDLASEAGEPGASVARRFPGQPIVGVGAVVFDGDRVLLVQRAHEPLKGHWSLPGGAVQLGETLREAVAREVFEETGLVVDVGTVVEIVERVDRNEHGRVEYHFIIVDYHCTRSGGSLAAASDAAAVRWVPVGEVAALALTPPALAVIAKAFHTLHRSC